MLSLTAVHVRGVDNRAADAISSVFSFVRRHVTGNPSESGHYTAVGTGCSVDLGHQEEMVSNLVDASIAPTTKRVYMSGQRKYLAFVRIEHVCLWHI